MALLLEHQLDSAKDAFPVYDYCRKQGITPFIDIKMVFLSVKWAYICTAMALKKLKIVQNSGVLMLTVNKDASVERSNKREKEDYKLEGGRHRSSKMWYCRLYAIMMLQHLDAWEMPSVEAFQKTFKQPV